MLNQEKTDLEDRYMKYVFGVDIGGTTVKMEAEAKIENVEKAFEYIRKVRRF